MCLYAPHMRHTFYHICATHFTTCVPHIRHTFYHICTTHALITCTSFQGFYKGGSAIALRQMSNWASRQGFTEAVRDRFKIAFHDGNRNAQLTKSQEVGAGIVGGACAVGDLTRCQEIDSEMCAQRCEFRYVYSDVY